MKIGSHEGIVAAEAHFPANATSVSNDVFDPRFSRFSVPSFFLLAISGPDVLHREKGNPLTRSIRRSERKYLHNDLPSFRESSRNRQQFGPEKRGLLDSEND
jgi:hypothetical protein